MRSYGVSAAWMIPSSLWEHPCPRRRHQTVRVVLELHFFKFDGEFYLQVYGTSMSSPVSPMLCNMYMESFEQKALATAGPPPNWWKRYVDDTHTISMRENSQGLTDYCNSIDELINWTTEGEVEAIVEKDEVEKKERTLAFLDTVTVLQKDGSINTRIVRKETHTNQYSNFESKHPLLHKRDDVRTEAEQRE